ncbi:MAG: hypothetical protein ACOCPM_03490 [Bacteroidales bacterium]
MYRQKRNIIVATAIVITCLTSISLQSQTRIASPYSRYGIGSLSQTVNSRALGMGSVSQAIHNPIYINYDNPASYTEFRRQSFVFNGGIRSLHTQLSTTNKTAKSNYTSLGYLQFGTPITKWMNASFGLIPYSNVGYNINNIQQEEGIGRVLHSYEGNGGINQFYIGSGFTITPNLSVGFNATYYFGKMEFERSTMFPDSINYLDTRISDRQSPGDIGLSFGATYKKQLSEDYTLRIGATFSNKTDLQVNRDYIVESIKKASEEVFTVFDTIEKDLGHQGNIILPTRIGGGFSLRKNELWELAGDFTYQNWQDYKAFGVKDSLQNSFTAALGYEITPKSTSVSSYLKKVDYRIGAKYHKSYLQLRNTQLNQFGISFGLGLPVPRSASKIDIGVEFGQMGTTDNNLVEEKYIKLSVGLSIFERWFIQRKYD